MDGSIPKDKIATPVSDSLKYRIIEQQMDIIAFFGPKMSFAQQK